VVGGDDVEAAGLGDGAGVAGRAPVGGEPEGGGGHEPGVLAHADDGLEPGEMLEGEAEHAGAEGEGFGAVWKRAAHAAVVAAERGEGGPVEKATGGGGGGEAEGVGELLEAEVGAEAGLVAVGAGMAGGDAVVKDAAGREVLGEQEDASVPVSVEALGAVEAGFGGKEGVGAGVARDAVGEEPGREWGSHG